MSDSDDSEGQIHQYSPDEEDHDSQEERDSEEEEEEETALSRDSIEEGAQMKTRIQRRHENVKMPKYELSSTGGSTLHSVPEGGFLGQVSFDSFNQTAESQATRKSEGGGKRQLGGGRSIGGSGDDDGVENNEFLDPRGHAVSADAPHGFSATMDTPQGHNATTTSTAEILEVEKALREAGFTSAPNSGLVETKFISKSGERKSVNDDYGLEDDVENDDGEGLIRDDELQTINVLKSRGNDLLQTESTKSFGLSPIRITRDESESKDFPASVAQQQQQHRQHFYTSSPMERNREFKDLERQKQQELDANRASVPDSGGGGDIGEIIVGKGAKGVNGTANHPKVVEDSLQVVSPSAVSDLERQVIILKSQIRELRREKTNDERSEQLKRELEEQEMILIGYQKENEKLYGEMKRISRDAKLGENARAEDILKKKQEIAKLVEEVSSKDAQLRNLRTTLEEKCAEEKRVVKASCSLCQLKDSENAEMNRILEEKRRQIHELEGIVFAAKENEKRMASAAEERNKDIEARIRNRDTEVAEIKAEYEKELALLKSKLERSLEELNFRDRRSSVRNNTPSNARISESEAETEEKWRREKAAMSEVLMIKEKEKNEAKEERKKMEEELRDVKRQLKECENLLKKRNSIGTTFNRFGWNNNSTTTGSKIPPPPPVSAFSNRGISSTTQNILETNIKRLQTRLDEKDADSAETVEALQQRFGQLSGQYEERMNKLKLELAEKNRSLEERKVCLECRQFAEKEEQMEAKAKSMVETIAKLKKEREISKGALISKEKRYQDQIVALNEQLQEKEKRLLILESKVALGLKTVKTASKDGVGEKRDVASEKQEVAPQAWQEDRTKLNDRIDGLLREISSVNADRNKWKGQSELLVVDLEEEKKLRQKIASEKESFSAERNVLREEVASLKARMETLKEKEASRRILLETSADAAVVDANRETILKLKTEFGKQIRKSLELEQELIIAKFAEEKLAKSNSIINLLRTRISQLEDALSEAKENRSPSAKKIDRLEERLVDISRRQHHREDLIQRYAATSFAITANKAAEAHKSKDELMLENLDLKTRLADKEKMVGEFKKEMDSIIDGLKALGIKNV